MTRRPAWPVLAAFLAAFGLTVVASQALVLVVAQARAAGDPGRVPAEASRFARSLQGLASVEALDACVLLALALVVASMSGGHGRVAQRVGDGLGLRRGPASVVGLGASVVGVTGLSLAGSAVFEALGFGQGEVPRVIGDALRAAGPAGVAFALVTLAAAPALAEETFFRGLMQRRLSASWGPWPGIVATAAAFGLLHLDPAQGTLAFVIGILLGWIAARLESTRAAILAHGTNNALALLLGLARPSPDPPGESWVAIGVGLTATAAAIVVLRSPRALRASTHAS